MAVMPIRADLRDPQQDQVRRLGRSRVRSSWRRSNARRHRQLQLHARRARGNGLQPHINSIRALSFRPSTARAPRDRSTSLGWSVASGGTCSCLFLMDNLGRLIPPLECLIRFASHREMAGEPRRPLHKNPVIPTERSPGPPETGPRRWGGQQRAEEPAVVCFS